MADPVVRGGAATVNRHIIISVVGIGAFGIVRSIVKNEGFSEPIIGAYILMVMLSLADILGGNVSMITGGIAYVALLTVILSSIDAFTQVGKMLNRKPPSASGGGSGSTKR